MTKKERVLAVMKKEQVDMIPAGFWFHYKSDYTVQQMIDEHMKLFRTILTIKQGFTSFDFPYALTGGGPVRATEVIGILIYNDAFKNMRFSMANAEACILFVIVAIFSLTQLKLTSKGGTD